MTTLQSNDPYRLERFIEAQRNHYHEACAELGNGQKRTHWMWFIFPQFRGLGLSDISQHFAIGSMEEAQAYLEHTVLGPRLVECSRLVLAIEGKGIGEVFGSPDDLKLRSSMTLFARATDQYPEFSRVLERYFNGHFDLRTLQLLGLK